MTVEYVIQDCDTHHKFDDAIECPFCEINRLRAERQDWLTRSKAMGRKLDDLTGTLERVRDLLPSRPHTAILIIDTVLSIRGG